MYLRLCLVLLTILATLSPLHARLHFVENRNQWPSQVHFRADITGGALFLTPGGFTYNYYSLDDLNRIHELRHKPGTDVSREPVRFHAYRVHFAGSNTAAPATGLKQLPFYHNYFLGNDSKRWAGKVGVYEGVRYEALYPGIDLHVYSKGPSPKYDFIVAPGADAALIRLQFEGVKPRLTEKGDIRIQTSVNSLLEQAPVAFQELDGRKTEVPCRYRQLADGSIGFDFPKGYDVSKPLLIDPVLVFATFSGSSAMTFGFSATYDATGHLYAGGEVFGAGWPATTGAYQMNFGGSVDAGINKYAPDGSSLIYSTYFGGSGSDLPNNMIVGPGDELVVCGSTSSPNMPTTPGCYDNTLGGMSDLFVARFNAGGSALIGATFVGGGGIDGQNIYTLSPNYGDANRGEVLTDDQGYIYVAGSTQSADFPVSTGALQATHGGAQDGCVFKLSPDCTQLIFSTYLGGSGEDACFSLVRNTQKQIVVCGGTSSSDFPTTTGAYSSQYQGSTDAFVAILDSAGQQLVHASFLGTTDMDHGYKIQLDPQDQVYVCGQTQGNFPMTAGLYGVADATIFIAQMSADLSSLMQSTRIGSNQGNLVPTAFLYDNCGNIYFCGFQAPPNLPLTANAWQTSQGGFWLSVLGNSMTQLQYATYMGAPGDHVDGGSSRFDPQGIVYHSVCTGSSQFPATAGSYAPTKNPGAVWDVGSFKFNFEAMGVIAGIGLDPASNDSICLPGAVQFANQSAAAQSYVWDFGDHTTSTDVAPLHVYTAPGQYRVRLVALNPALCIPDDTAWLDIYVFDVEKPVLDLRDTIICDPGQVQLSAPVSNLNANMTFKWEPASAILTDPSKQTVTVDATASMVFTVRVVDSVGQICKEFAEGSITTTVFDKAQFQAFGDTVICPGDTVSLTATGGQYYSWFPTDRNSLPLEPNTLVWPTSTTVYKVMIRNDLGCEAERPVRVTVYPKVEADAGEDRDLKLGESLFLNAGGGVSYQWQPDASLSGADRYNPKVQPRSNTTYYVTVTSGMGCKAVDSVHVHVTHMLLPQAFSPNGDGLNDVFRMLPWSDAVRLLDMSIFDRWGNMVFSSSNSRQGWDGRYRGHDCEIGSYYYRLEYSIDNVRYTEKGEVTLMR